MTTIFCEGCHASGFDPRGCAKCRGAGRMVACDAMHDDTSDGKRDECDECSGTGLVPCECDGGTCGECGTCPACDGVPLSCPLCLGGGVVDEIDGLPLERLRIAAVGVMGALTGAVRAMRDRRIEFLAWIKLRDAAQAKAKAKR